MIDVVERPPKYNGAFRRPLKLMAVYNLRNQQAVTCNTGCVRVYRECVLGVYVLNPYLRRENPFISRRPEGSLSPRSLPRRGQRRRRGTTLVDYDGAAFLIPRTLARVLP